MLLGLAIISALAEYASILACGWCGLPLQSICASRWADRQPNTESAAPECAGVECRTAAIGQALGE